MASSDFISMPQVDFFRDLRVYRPKIVRGQSILRVIQQPIVVRDQTVVAYMVPHATAIALEGVRETQTMGFTEFVQGRSFPTHDGSTDVVHLLYYGKPSISLVHARFAATIDPGLN